QIKKRNGDNVKFDKQKIAIAISKANKETDEDGMSTEVNVLVDKVIDELKNSQETITVEDVQDTVENVLLHSDYKATAKAYILSRDERRRGRRSNIFEPRINLKPYEYPQLIEYQHAIQHSYWLHTEFNYTADIQNFNVDVSDKERNAIKNAMLAIAQVEVAVKNFWGDLH